MSENLESIFSYNSPKPLMISSQFSIFVIAALQGEGIDTTGLTQEALRAQIEETIRRDQANEKKGRALLTYDFEGKRRVPIFSSHANAQLFCAKYSEERKRVFPFMVVEAKSSLLARIAAGSYDQIVMNDKTPDAHVVSPEERAQWLALKPD